MRLQLIHFCLWTIVGVIQAQTINESKKQETDGRLLLSTFTIILSTVTSTNVIGTTTTCTTSSSAMPACSAQGRRRRGILYDQDEKTGRNRRGLFYNDDEKEGSDDSTFLTLGHTKRSTEFVKKDIDPSVTLDNAKFVPLTIQSGFSVPEGYFAATPRFKLAYGTTTLTTTSTSTATRSLFIFCNSITDYQVCSGPG